jgi:NAD(P)-dependent dehydrogenase (short-subunit alcohol dehydrogenase family)
LLNFMSQPLALTGKVAIITGASREIGAAAAARLAAEGAAVVLSHHNETALAEAHAQAIRAAGGTAVVFDADLTQTEPCEALVDFAERTFGHVDIMYANAGVTVFKPFLETDAATWDLQMNLNVRGAFFCAQAAAKRMIKHGQGGRVIFSSSVAGIRAAPGISAYSVTKAALRQMARTLSAELAVYKITVNAIGIGAVLNERNVKIDPAYAETWGRMNPLGRVILPDDVAGAVRFLCSDDAAMITGQTIVVDGGWVMAGRTSAAKEI